MITHYIRKSPKGERLEEFTPAQANFIGAVFHGGVTLKTAEKLLAIWNRQGTQNGRKIYEYRLPSDSESPVSSQGLKPAFEPESHRILKALSKGEQ